MKHVRALLCCALLGVAASASAQKMAPLEWAFPITPPGFKPAPDDGTLRRVPDSSAGYTLTQLRNRFLAPVWHPGDHPALPKVVSSGREPNVFACGFCHRADGPGGPENASLAGLPQAYLAQQMRDFRSGARGTSVDGRNTQLMISLAKDISDAEIDAAATYFSSLRPRQSVKVVETDAVPKTFIIANHYAKLDGTNDKEPIGKRIVEMPEELERFVSRDTRTRFIAYVPLGSVQAGRELATTGGGRTTPCATCHGPDLRGVANVPGIAGRFASYTGRQLYDFKSGARNGPESALMKGIVEKLTAEDMLSLSAYLASLEP